MRNIFVKGQVVTLVTIPQFLPVLVMPHIGEYENSYIEKLTPCAKRDGKYFDLRSGKEVTKSPNSLEWLNLTGTVFRYEDGVNLLISRKLSDGMILGLPIGQREIRKTMVVRTIFDRTKDKKNS